MSVPDGYTLDGAGHTITAVQSGGSFAGAILVTDSSTTTPTAIHVRNVHLTSKFGTSQFLIGIQVSGSLTVANTTLNRMGDGQSGGAGIYTPSAGGPNGRLAVSNVQITHYGDFGIIAGTILKATHLSVGRADAQGSTSEAIPDPDSVFLYGAPSASITDSHLSNNIDTRGSTTPAAALATQAVGAVTLTRAVITGSNGDDGITAYNSNTSSPTTLRLLCSSISRTTTSAADPGFGYGIDTANVGGLDRTGPVRAPSLRHYSALLNRRSSAGSTGSAVKVQLGGVEFAGWRKNVNGTTPTKIPASCATRSSISLHAGDYRVDDEKAAHLFGRIAPVRAGSIVSIQTRHAGRWHTVKTTPERRSGRFSAYYRTSVHGLHEFRARVATGSGHHVVSRTVGIRFY